MDERKIHNMYQICFKYPQGEEILEVNCIPPFAVGQNLQLDKCFSDGKRRTENYRIAEINHKYQYMNSIHPDEEFNTFSVQVVLEKLEI